MEIKCIFAPYLYAFKFNGRDLDEYKLGIDQWNNVSYLKNFHKINLRYIKGNEHFPDPELFGFVDLITSDAEIFDDEIMAAANAKNLGDYFEALTKTKNFREILPHKKTRQNVLRFYGIMLGDTIIITGSAIKLTERMEDHPDTAKQLIKLESVQDFLIQNEIRDEDSFFEYLEENQL
ncbi:hypothetical protein [Chryseobacterium sp.]|uniref:hypothetical protein n=1 Tax=Chryseobacterium sp. TaxID=1871047 RepID=UPI0031D0C616